MGGTLRWAWKNYFLIQYKKKLVISGDLFFCWNRLVTSLCGNCLNHGRLQKSSKTWDFFFPWSKWIAGNILCIFFFFFSIPEDAFILCIGFFDRFRKMLLEAEIIDFVFYVCHRDYIYICMKLPFFIGVYMIDDILFNAKLRFSIVM